MVGWHACTCAAQLTWQAGVHVDAHLAQLQVELVHAHVPAAGHAN